MLSERKRSSYRTSCGDDVAFGSDEHINELEDTLERLMSFRNTRKRGTAAKTDVTRALHRVKGDLRTAIRERDKVASTKKRRSLKEALGMAGKPTKKLSSRKLASMRGTSELKALGFVNKKSRTPEMFYVDGISGDYTERLYENPATGQAVTVACSREFGIFDVYEGDRLGKLRYS